MNKKGILTSLASLGAVQIANYVFPLISVPIVSRIIGPEKFGVINYAASFIMYFNLLIGYGFDYTAIRKIVSNELDRGLRNKIVSEVLYAKIILFIVSTLLFIVCVNNLTQLSAEKQVAIYSFFVCVATVVSQNWLFQAMHDLPKMAVLTLLGKLLFTVAIILTIRVKQDYAFQPLITGIVQILVAVSSFYWAFKRYDLKLQPFDFIKTVKMIYYERMIFFSMVVISLYTTTNVIILGYITNNVQVGYYTAAQKLIDIVVSVINIPLAQILFPIIGVAFSQDQGKGIRSVQKILPLVFYFGLFISLFLLVAGSPLLVLFYGKAFSYSTSIFNILIIVPLIISINNLFCVQVMLNLKMDKAFFYISSGGALLGICLNLFMTSRWGGVGTAWNWIIVETYITLVAYIILRKKGIELISLSEFKFQNIYRRLKSI